MNRKIIIKGREGRFDVPLFLLSDNEDLNISLEIPVRRRGKYYMALEHGTVKKRVVLNERLEVVLSAGWLQQGGMAPILASLELRDESGTIVYERYSIEPLELIDSEVGTEYLATVQALERQDQELKRNVQALEQSIEEVRKIVDGIPGMIEQAKREAVIKATGGDPMRA